MARIEKTVFISYRRTDVYTALAVYENLKNQGYDVFFDYRSISSGDFEQIITANIKARAHFLIILTPTALDRLNEPGDWLRREIEIAIEEKRNIIPLFFKGFRFGIPSASDKLTGKLKNLSRYNGLNVHEDYFDEAMHRLREQYLSKPLDAVLHPVSTEVRKVVKEEQNAADEALKHIDEKKGPKAEPAPSPVVPSQNSELDVLKSQAIQYELRGDLYESLQTYYKIKRMDPLFPSVDLKIGQLERELQPVPIARDSEKVAKKRLSSSAFPWRLIARWAGGITVITLCIWGGWVVFNNVENDSVAKTPSVDIFSSQTSDPMELISYLATQTAMARGTKTPSINMSTVEAYATQSAVPQGTPALGIGSTIIGKDGMTLLYVPTGEFTMGSEENDDEKPIHTVALNAFWIDKTEITNAMFAKFIDETRHTTDAEKAGKSYVYKDGSWQKIDGADWLHPLGTSSSISDVMDHPVVHVSWNDAQAYCSWADRRLPTEAEWEKAASWDADNQQKYVYPWGNDFDGDRLNFCDNNCSSSWADKDSNDGYEFTAPVGSYPNGASPYGALDMAGNVWEWVDDWYDAYPGNTISNSRYGTTYRVLRGGAWYLNDDGVRSSIRGWSNPTYTYVIIGFRCARSP